MIRHFCDLCYREIEDPDYFINLFESFSYCDSVEEKEEK